MTVDNGQTAGVEPEGLSELVAAIFTASGLSASDAEAIAAHLVEADLRGVDSHGVSRTGIYVHRLRLGLVEARPRRRVLTETPVSALLDAGNGPGIVAAEQAMGTAIAKAAESGVGMVSVRNSNHCGMLAHYTARAARAGLVALATTSAPAAMAPWGAKDPYFGTNPVSYAVPTPGGRPDIVFDMATSHVAKGKIILAGKNGQSIPLGWALDGQGAPTTDPAAALDGSLLPLGGAKGSGLALLVEVLSALLSGSRHGPHIPPLYDNDDHPQDLGHFFLAMSPEVFLPADEFASRVGSLAEEVAALPAAEGHGRVYLPGEPEAERADHRRRNGVPLSEGVRAELRGVARELGIGGALTAVLGDADPAASPAAAAESAEGAPR
ncbi:Ldh family oxidoreductase [Streptomonospora litoralis]|uniref:Putative oxidoreductase YjmC n=1 Tax=Streptomonospora litoralis TaxID=2498135 RepID=A0A4P6Q2U6_9ACTN|nr:Ldh family oxidoreductase [Streptomonospora litoralis]QBI54976.1 putative oxidoreductase YjmC [Streptomonospora litoralis]